MKNPKWQREEIILALELYFKLEHKQMRAENSKVIELSEILKQLPINEYKAEKERFRNSNSVELKLKNFLAIDPNYHGKGMASYSKLDKEIFNEFVNNKAKLSSVASILRKTAQNYELRGEIYKIEEENEDNFSVREGQIIYKFHKHIERNTAINQKKKNLQLKKYGKLECEVCGFDFYDKYGVLGKGFIECHHKKPLHEIDEEVTTSFEDLALVCANCHRMLHRDLNVTIGELKIIITEEK